MKMSLESARLHLSWTLFANVSQRCGPSSSAGPCRTSLLILHRSRIGHDAVTPRWAVREGAQPKVALNSTKPRHSESRPAEPPDNRLGPAPNAMFHAIRATERSAFVKCHQCVSIVARMDPTEPRYCSRAYLRSVSRAALHSTPRLLVDPTLLYHEVPRHTRQDLARVVNHPVEYLRSRHYREQAHR